jgi:hypothetical protein
MKGDTPGNNGPMIGQFVRVWVICLLGCKVLPWSVEKDCSHDAVWVPAVHRRGDGHLNHFPST